MSEPDLTQLRADLGLALAKLRVRGQAAPYPLLLGYMVGECADVVMPLVAAAVSAARLEGTRQGREQLSAEIFAATGNRYGTEQGSGHMTLAERLGITPDPEITARFERDMQRIREAERAVDLNHVIGSAAARGVGEPEAQETK